MTRLERLIRDAHITVAEAYTEIPHNPEAARRLLLRALDQLDDALADTTHELR